MCEGSAAKKKKRNLYFHDFNCWTDEMKMEGNEVVYLKPDVFIFFLGNFNARETGGRGNG